MYIKYTEDPHNSFRSEDEREVSQSRGQVRQRALRNVYFGYLVGHAKSRPGWLSPGQGVHNGAEMSWRQDRSFAFRESRVLYSKTSAPRLEREIYCVVDAKGSPNLHHHQNTEDIV
jgi:hypothetical protein